MSENQPSTSGASIQNTKADLLKKLQQLKEQELTVDKQISDLEAAGVKESDAVDIMNALHAYNEIKDVISEVFNVLIKLNQTTSAELYTNIQRSSVALETAKEKAEQEKSTHFGFESVKESEKAKRVHEVFENVAGNYDLMNDVMSVGVHRLWKDIFLDRLGPRLNTKLLDVAGGTGDIAFRYLKYLFNLPNVSRDEVMLSDSHVTVCDINGAMLKVGQSRAEKLGFPASLIDWTEGDAERPPFGDGEFTAYTIAFGIRNVTHIDRALSEAYRVLKPGGRFMCLEFSHLNNSLAQWAYDQYSFQMIPVLGQLVAGQWQSYQYLVESIRKFPNQRDFCSMIEEAGFRNVTYENLSLGVVAIHSGFKI
ncbi:Coenzyme Q5 [Carabus blaptoides fortunei]